MSKAKRDASLGIVVYSESELAEALDAYTDPNSDSYDPEFDAQIRALRPDWFEPKVVH